MKLIPQSTLGAPFRSASAVAGFAPGRGTLSERADIGCVLLTAALDPADLHELNAAVAEVELPRSAGRLGLGVRRRAMWLSPRSWLLLCDMDVDADLVNRINAAFPDKRVHAAYFSDYLCWLELSGPDVREILQDFGFVSLEWAGLPLHHAKRTLIAGITAVIVRENEDTYLIGVERSRVRYFVERILDTVRVAAAM